MNVIGSNKQYLEIKEMFNRLRNEMSKSVQSFYIWETLHLSKSTKEVGEKLAQKNVETMKKFIHFFLLTEFSHLNSFIVGFHKFFDKSGSSFNIEKLVKKIKKYKPTLILQDEDKEIAQLKQKHTKLQKELEKMRHKIVHNTLEVTIGTFIPNDVEDFITSIQEMLNKISRKLEDSTNSWENLKNFAIIETESLISALQKSENKI